MLMKIHIMCSVFLFEFATAHKHLPHLNEPMRQKLFLNIYKP